GFSAPELNIGTAASGALRKKTTRPRLVAIPLSKVHAGTHGHRGDRAWKLHDLPAVDAIAAPSTWCPNPAKTACLRVKGDSMLPLIHDDYILAVDTSDHKIQELWGKVVVAWHKTKGLTVSRLERIDRLAVLVSENRKYDSISMGRNSGWRIVGKVLWWIGKPD